MLYILVKVWQTNKQTNSSFINIDFFNDKGKNERQNFCSNSPRYYFICLLISILQESCSQQRYNETE